MGNPSWFGDGERPDARILPSAGARCQGARARLIFTLALIAALPFLAGCASRSAVPAVSSPAPDEQTGTIRRVGTLGFAIVPDRDPGTRYAPERPFPPEFQVDGLRVRFSGSVTDSPNGVRQWATPFRLATLRRIDP
jgi:hypothetical protein